MKLSRLFGVIAIICLLAGAGLLFVSAITITGAANPRVIGTVWISFGFALLSYVAAATMERATFGKAMALGMLAGAIGWPWWLAVVWLPLPMQRAWLVVPITLTSAAALAAFTGAMYLLPVTGRRVRWIRFATVLVAAVLATAVTAGLSWWLSAGVELPYRDRMVAEERLLRTGGLLVTVVACGALAGIAAALGPRLVGGGEVADADRIELTVTCPRCERRQVIRSHGDACRRCGLRIKVTPI